MKNPYIDDECGVDYDVESEIDEWEESSEKEKSSYSSKSKPAKTDAEEYEEVQSTIKELEKRNQKYKQMDQDDEESIGSMDEFLAPDVDEDEQDNGLDEFDEKLVKHIAPIPKTVIKPKGIKDIIQSQSNHKQRLFGTDLTNTNPMFSSRHNKANTIVKVDKNLQNEELPDGFDIDQFESVVEQVEKSNKQSAEDENDDIFDDKPPSKSTDQALSISGFKDDFTIKNGKKSTQMISIDYDNKVVSSKQPAKPSTFKFGFSSGSASFKNSLALAAKPPSRSLKENELPLAHSELSSKPISPKEKTKSTGGDKKPQSKRLYNENDTHLKFNNKKFRIMKMGKLVPNDMTQKSKAPKWKNCSPDNYTHILDEETNEFRIAAVQEVGISMDYSKTNTGYAERNVDDSEARKKDILQNKNKLLNSDGKQIGIMVNQVYYETKILPKAKLAPNTPNTKRKAEPIATSSSPKKYKPTPFPENIENGLNSIFSANVEKLCLDYLKKEINFGSKSFAELFTQFSCGLADLPKVFKEPDSYQLGKLYEVFGEREKVQLVMNWLIPAFPTCREFVKNNLNLQWSKEQQQS